MATADPSFQQAVRVHQAGQPEQARRLYEDILRREPRHAHALSMLGLSIGQTGDWQRGCELMREAVNIDGSHPALLANLADACRNLGLLAEAEDHYRRAVQLHPNLAGLHNQLAVVLMQSGKLDAAIDSFQTALRLDSQTAETHGNLASALRRQGNLHQSEAAFRRALELRPDYFAAWNNLGGLLADQDRWPQALECWQRAVELEPSLADARYNVGNALRAMGQLDGAIAAYRKALELDDEHVRARANLGNVLREALRFDEALDVLELAVRMHPDVAVVHNNLANVLQDLGRLSEARESFARAIQLAPAQADFHLNMGTVLAEQGQITAAIACYERSLEMQSDYAEALCRRGTARLALGEFAAGWADYEARRRTAQFRGVRFEQPQWTGTPLAGRTLLVHCEQGLGDTLQFIRYLNLVEPSGGRIVVSVQRALVPLLSESGFTNLVPNDEPPPTFDVHVPLMSLPYVFGTVLETVPRQVPYLAAEPARVAKWAESLRQYPGLKVGIVWQGRPTFRGDRLRSVPLASLAPVAEVAGVRLLSLQKGHGSEQLAELDGRFEVINLAAELDNDAPAFMDTAAVMKNLDVVISSDTAAAHLAGGLGVRVWVALAFAPEWRWMIRRDDSPWYRTMRLFRQIRPVQWSNVFKRMAAELAKLEPGVGSQAVDG